MGLPSQPEPEPQSGTGPTPVGHAETAWTTDTDGAKTVRHGLRFWAVMVGLGITLILSALEHSVLVTAAPVVLSEVSLGYNWVWLTNAFFLCSAAFQPLFGQLFNIFGRKPVTLCIIALFVLGSGICGGAKNAAMLIAGRAIQGVGSGGIVTAFETIVSDLVPLRSRGSYIAVIMLIYAIGTTLGPFIGGAIVETGTWRWIFYINLPIGGVSFLIISFFFNDQYRRQESPIRSLKRIDFVGNALIIASTTAMLYALSYAGTRYPWSSWHTLVPLLCGVVGYGIFAVYETSRWAPAEPVMPSRLFSRRTSAIVAINNFQNQLLMWWGIFFLPVYFQAVQLDSPRRAGVCLIPLSLFGIPAAAVAGAVLARVGRYKMIHLIGFSLFMIGRGLYTLLDETTPTAEWVAYQLVAGVGGGMLLNTLLPAFQAPLDEADQATATAAFNCIRTLGSAWGIAIPAAVFANRVDEIVRGGAITDKVASEQLMSGGAYQHASAMFVKQFESQTQLEIRRVYRDAIRYIFLVSFAFMGLALLLAVFERDVPLRKELNTKYGMRNDKEAENGQQSGNTASRIESNTLDNPHGSTQELHLKRLDSKA